MRDFLTDTRLPGEDRDEILAAMKDVQIKGWMPRVTCETRSTKCEPMGARATYRVLFAAEGARSQVLLGLSGSSKKTRKTPPAEIGLAEHRLRDWRARGR